MYFESIFLTLQRKFPNFCFKFQFQRFCPISGQLAIVHWKPNRTKKTTLICACKSVLSLLFMDYVHKSLAKMLSYSQNGSCVLTSKLCAEVWRTGYEYSLNPGKETSKIEMETQKFPAKTDFNFHWKSSSLQTKLQTSDQIFCFRF